MALSSADVTSMQASLAEMFLHRFEIERGADGAEDEYGHPAVDWSQLAVVTGNIIPASRLSAPDEVPQVNEAGAVIVTDTILLLPTDVVEADRIRHVKATCPVPDARDLPDAVYQITGVHNSAGTGLNLAVDVKVIR